MKFKKLAIILALSTVAVLLTSVVCLAGVDWENCVWLSVDQEQQYKRMGFFHRDDLTTKVVSEYGHENTASFDISISNTLMEFDRNSGIYGQFGVNSRDRINILFGAGYIYQNSGSDLMFTLGTKYYMQDQTVVNELQLFYRVFAPVVLNLGYDDLTNAIFIGLGLTYN